MKKLLLLLCFAPILAFSQEPEFIGEVNIQKEDGSYQLLEKQYACTTSSTDIGVYLIGIGSIHNKYVIQGKCSNVRISKGDKVTLIVRTADNNYDPASTVGIIKFKNGTDVRKADLSTVTNFDLRDFKLNTMYYSAKKYGSSSYEITLENVENGEYGVIQFNPKQDTNRLMVISCFGIGKEKKAEKYF